MSKTMCDQCDRPLVEIDNYGERSKTAPRAVLVCRTGRRMGRCHREDPIVRIFAGKNVRPSKVLTNCVSTGAMPFLASATETRSDVHPNDTGAA